MAKILVVDDEEDTRDLVSFVLKRDGHEVSMVKNGQECLDRVAYDKPDLILLDVMMPVMDGYTVFNRLAEGDDTRSIPVLVMTAKGEMKDVFQMSSNVVGYMEKPFDLNTLQMRVRQILAKPR